MDTMASQGDGKKRRSFLPAPKRASESQFAAPQASTIPRMIQSQLPTMQTASSVYSREPSQIPSFVPREPSQIPSFAPRPPPSVSFREHAKAPPGSSHFNERQKGESSFGTGLHVGARVKIGGVKPGILRYLGPTHLAPGTFCGIELLDPDGNHNGEVNGHRYFFCLPNHGIFAPKEKVCLDTSDDLGNLVSDSEMYYSNTGSLSDKRHRTHKSYPEGEFSSKAFPKSSNTANSYGAQYTEDGAPSRRHRDIEGIGRSNLPSPYNPQTERPYNPQTERPYNPQTGRSEPVQTYGFNEASAHRLSNYAPPSSQSPLPNYSRAYLKYQDEFNSQRSPAYSNQSDSSQTSSFEAPADIHEHQTHEEYDRAASVHTKYGSKPGHYFDNSLAQGTLSTDVKHQLDAGNRQFLNFTFDRDELNRSEDFSEMESDSSFYEEEFDTKGRNMVREDYLKYADVGNFRGISSALDKANKQQYHEHLRETNTQSFVPAEDANYPRSGYMDASVSDNYATFRAGLNAANSALKYGEGNASIIDYSLAEKGGSGLVTDFHSSTDERISEGGYIFKSSNGDKIGEGSEVVIFDTQDSQAKRVFFNGSKIDNVVKEVANSSNEIRLKIGLSRETKEDNTKPGIGLSAEKQQRYISGSGTGLSRKTKGESGLSEINKRDDIEPRNDLPGETKGNNTEGNVNGPSPDIVQNLEWDYGQEFEENQSVSTSTGTSESLNDRLKDISDDNNSFCEGDMSSGLTDDSDHEFETIDELSVFARDLQKSRDKSRNLENSFGFCSTKHSSVVTSGDLTDVPRKQGNMTPSVTITSISSDSSQDTLVGDCATGTPGSAEDHNFFNCDLKNIRSKDSFLERLSTSSVSVICVDELKTLKNKIFAREDDDENNKLRISGLKVTSRSSDSNVVTNWAALNNRREDTKNKSAGNEINTQGHDIPGTDVNRKERPLSLLSTSSTDTGYVPDTESELGTLISNTPDADWVDRCGIPHPTTHAPLDEDATVAEKKEDNTLVKSAGNVLSKTVAKATDDDDNNSDLTGNAEDDRVEADRLDGQNAKVAPHGDEPVNIDVSSKEDMGNDSERYHKDESVTPELSPESPKTEDYKDRQSLHTEDTTPENKGKPRKTVVITKKRSENVDHKMPNTNVTSRLADYIKAPVQVKSKEEKEKEKELKKSKSVKNASQSSKSKQETGRGSSEKGDNKVEEKPEKIEKPKPIIKRERPKSKWDNIMCQIEVSKDTVKVKPISEIKSSLAEYLHTPAPQLPTDDTEIMPTHPRKEFKSKLKPLPPPPPKIDLSKVKSKLNVPTAASAIKAMPKREKPPKAVNLKNDNRATRESSTTLNAESALPENNDDMRKMSNSSLVPETTQAELSALEIKDDSSQAHGKEGLSSKSSTADIKKDSHRSSIHSAKLENADKPKSSAEQVSKSGESLKKVSQASTFQSKKATTPAPKVTRNAVPSNIRSTRSTSKNITRKDFEQLESLCEARAEEVAQLKLHLDTTIQAFDAMAVLANYCSNELNAFECPALSQKLENVQTQLEDYAQQIAELNSQKATLDKDLDQLMQEKEKATQQTRAAQDGAQKERDDHEKLTQDLSHTHTTVLSTQRDELTAKHEETVNKLTQFYETQFELQRQAHDRQVSDIMNECKLEINSLKIANLEEVQELRNKHDDQMEELHKQHRCKMEDLSLRFEAIKFSLSEKVDCLRKECDDLVIRARNSEEALQRDSDFKVRIALAPYINLPREIESLKSIQGMRLEEIQKLRTKIVDLEKQLEEVPIAREKIISLHQKIENLEAIINIKTEHEKQLHQRCQVLMRKYDRESRANKRISMDFEQIMWRMSQSADFESSDDNLAKQQFSQSYHSGDVAPDSSRHSASLSRDSVHHARRRTSKNASEGDRKLRSKSANSVSGKSDSSCDHTTTAEPHLKAQTHTSTDQTAESDHFNRMCQSAGPEVMFELLSDNSCPQIQSDEHEEQTLTGPQGTSVFDMTRSYARSLSGVTDSGVYDSLTRSDVFDSSTASTDLELGMSVNLSGTCDDDLESGPAAGNYNLA